MDAETSSVLVIGGTGAMGSRVVARLLAQTRYDVVILTRNPDGERIRAMLQEAGPRLRAVKGDLNDPQSLERAMGGVRRVFCNTDFWSTASALGEYQQGVRALEAAKAADVSHFVWSSLDSPAALTSGRIPVPHFDAKAAVGGWIDLMRTDEFMRKDPSGWFSKHVSVLVTAPYYENFQFRLAPKAATLSDGRQGFAFNIALSGGKYPLVGLDDISWFAVQMLERPDEWAGRTLRILGDALTGEEIAKTFGRVTGQAAEYRNVPLSILRDGLPDTGHDLANMFQFFQEFDLRDRTRDMAALRSMHPGLMTFSDWLSTSGWKGQPQKVQKLAVQLPN